MEQADLDRNEIIEMLRASCDKEKVDPEQNGFWVITTEELEAFTKLVAAQATAKAVEREREECAKLCEYLGQPHEMQSMAESIWTEISGKTFAEAIRARGKPTLRGEA